MAKSRIAKDSSELAGRNQLDQIDRSDWPEGAELSDGSESTTEAVAKARDRNNPNKQPGTLGAKPMPYPTELPKQTQDKMKEFNVCVAIAVLQHVVFCSFFR